jgi:hypothetical protein
MVSLIHFLEHRVNDQATIVMEAWEEGMKGRHTLSPNDSRRIRGG